MAASSAWCLVACLFVLCAGITAFDETRYVRAGTDETLSSSMNGTVLTASWYYCEHCHTATGDYIFIASKSVPDTSFPRKDRIIVVYDTDNGVYDLTLLNFNGQTDVGIYICYIIMHNSEYFYNYFTVEFADGPSTASITGNVPVFVNDSLTLSCGATATPSVTFQWIKGNSIIGYNSTLTLSPARGDNGVIITCTAMNREYDDIRASVSVTLEVHLTHAEEKEQSNIGAVIGGTIAVIVVILLCGVVFMFMWKRRRSTKEKSDLEMPNCRRNRNILDQNPDEGDSADNTPNVTSGPSPEPEDVMYSEVKKLYKSPPTQDSEETVYSQVKKKGNVEGNDNVCPQVDKKLLRNKDGLTYAELSVAETSQQQAAQIIHGLEDTTDYAAKRGPTPPHTNVAEAGTAKEETQN